MVFEFLLTKDTLWVTFLFSALFTLIFAVKTVKYFTLFSIRSRINTSALGGIILALITSLPELVNGIVSGVQNSSNLIYSNVIGANSILLVFYAIFAMFFSKKSMKQVPSLSLSKIIISVMISVIVFASLFVAKETTTFDFGGHKMSLIVIGQLVLYIGFILYLIKGKTDLEETPSENIKTRLKKSSHIWLIFFIYSIGLIVFAILLNNVVDRMGASSSIGGYGLGSTVAGALLLSIVTTLPEIVSMFKLMKMGLLNVAAAAGIGSHMFNFTILFLSDAINQNAILEEVYKEAYIRDAYIWGMYIITYFVFINGLYNKYLKKNQKLIIINYLFIPITFIGGWIVYGVT